MVLENIMMPVQPRMMDTLTVQYGVFRVRHIQAGTVPNLSLHNTHSVLQGGLSDTDLPALSAGQVVEVQWTGEGGQVQFHHLAVLDREAYQPSLMMPSSYAPHPQDVATLARLVGLLKTSVMREWFEGVLDDSELMRGWFSCQASVKHHHAWPGGLLRHSLETTRFTLAAMQEAMAMQHEPMDPLLWDILVLSALLHDIGKVWVFDRARYHWLMGKSDHRYFTLTVLAAHLDRLQARSGKAHGVLCHTLSCVTNPQWTAKVPMVELIRIANRMSIGLGQRHDTGYALSD